MGGIFGKLSFDRQVQISPATVQRMLDAVAHRAGAPGSGRAVYTGHGVALGTCGDAPAPLAQVAHNESGTIRAIADSDLSNASSLRQLLEDRGHRIESGTDAELIAHAYEEWGDACVERFSGPFACAVWDDIQRRLLLARDHFGIKPLCFALLHGNGVVFASEVTALLQDPSVGRAWCPRAVDAYLALGYVPAPLTIHPRASKLEPAHTLIVEGRRLTTRRYWDLPSGPSRSASEREAVELLESCLGASLAAIAGGDDACFLVSGGVASSAIAALLPRGRSCVSVGIDMDPSDLDRISWMAAHLGLRSEIDVASLDGADLAPLLASHFDEPPADPAAVSHYAVFAAARRYATLAVTGHGAAAFWSGMQPSMLFGDGLRHAVYTRRFSRHVRRASPAAPHARSGRGWLADNQLALADRAAATAGLRLRHPYLDRDLADLACTLPDHLKLRDTTPMYALRQVAIRHVPPALLPLRTQVAFTPAWLPRALASLVPQVLLGESFDSRRIFSRPAIRALWDEHEAGRRDHARRLWSLVMLEFWFRAFIDGDPAARPLEQTVVVRAA